LSSRTRHTSSKRDWSSDVCSSDLTVWVDGKDTKAPEELWNVRQTAGMVFQNPDNQIIGTVVEEDVGFGPENLGVPTDEIWQRVRSEERRVGRESGACW